MAEKEEDIVERLRCGHIRYAWETPDAAKIRWLDERKEAADEIGRLRAALETIVNGASHYRHQWVLNVAKDALTPRSSTPQ